MSDAAVMFHLILSYDELLHVRRCLSHYRSDYEGTRAWERHQYLNESINPKLESIIKFALTLDNSDRR